MGNFAQSKSIGVIDGTLEFCVGKVSEQVVVVEEVLLRSQNDVSKSCLVCEIETLAHEFIH